MMVSLLPQDGNSPLLWRDGNIEEARDRFGKRYQILSVFGQSILLVKVPDGDWPRYRTEHQRFFTDVDEAKAFAEAYRRRGEIYPAVEEPENLVW